MPELTGRHDADLERTLLACCFANPEVLDESWVAMPDEVFYLERHREVWREILKQFGEAGAFDLSTVASAFIGRGNREVVAEVLTPIIGVFEGSYHPSSAYAELYAHQLKELYVAREKGLAARRFEAAVADGEDQNSARLEFEAVMMALDSSVQRFDERTDEELAALIGPGSRWQTGMGNIDWLTGGFAKPGLNIIAARPSVGKSALARSIIRHAAARGEKVLWYSKDQSENQILELEIARHKRISSDDVRRMDFKDVAAAIRAVRREVWRDRVTLIDSPMHLDNLMGIAKSTTPNLLVIDYIQILDTGHDDEYESITAASKALKTLAFQLRIPILALAQFNRGHKTGQVPTMANIRGSGQIEQDADQVYALERDTTMDSQQHQEAQLYVLKNKVGPTGVARLHWQPRWASFEGAAQ